MATSKATKLGPPSSSSKSGHWCTYCKKSSHTKENCFKLHEKDQVLSRTSRFRNINQGQAHLTTIESEIITNASQGKDEIPTLSKEELERLQTLIDTLSKLSSSCSLAMNGKNLCSSSLMLLVLSLRIPGLLTLVLLTIWPFILLISHHINPFLISII